MTKMTIEIPEHDYKMLKLAAVHMGVSIKDYVLDAIRSKEKILIRDDGVVRVLKKETVRALEESRKKKGGLKSYANVDQLMKDLKSSF
ncbi:MAG: hypothetical protein KGP29_01465 [Proteobacteria bacterium]|nr:hypothetical protein [Pseudomonadota bacterium]